MQEDNNDIILIDNGEIFNGTREQFKDCFFTNAIDDNIVSWCVEQNFTLSINNKLLVDKEVYIPIFERNKFIPFKTTFSWIYKGTGALPYFDTIEECGNWCKDSNSELKKQSINTSAEETTLEYKLLNFKMKLHGVKLTALQRECVLDAMKELSTQRKLGNFTNKMI
jgi:hypothetical protein